MVLHIYLGASSIHAYFNYCVRAQDLPSPEIYKYVKKYWKIVTYMHSTYLATCQLNRGGRRSPKSWLGIYRVKSLQDSRDAAFWPILAFFRHYDSHSNFWGNLYAIMSACVISTRSLFGKKSIEIKNGQNKKTKSLPSRQHGCSSAVSNSDTQCSM